MVKRVNVPVDLYKYDELKPEARQFAFQEHLDFMIEQGEINGELSVEETRRRVEESIRINDYYFFQDGTLAYVTHYTGNHPLSGKTEFHFKGKSVEVV